MFKLFAYGKLINRAVLGICLFFVILITIVFMVILHIKNIVG
jgi:hypothetical protein